VSRFLTCDGAALEFGSYRVQILPVSELETLSFKESKKNEFSVTQESNQFDYKSLNNRK
jgi:hypothetical protein